MTQIPCSIKMKEAILMVCILALSVFPARSQSTSRPNILVILLDDARYDSFGPNGGPGFFNTPAINSIAQEGANFKNFFVTTALCGPSRSSIYTGLYTHHHGCRENVDSPDSGLIYVSSILKDAGYYTGFIGKWLLDYEVPDKPVGFNYYAVTDSFKHINPVIEFNNGMRVQYYGYDAEIYTDLALHFLNNKVPAGHPWLLFMAHRAPHAPYERLAEDSTRYDNETKPFPSNFDYYQTNFPSHLYPNKEYPGNTDSLVHEIEEYFETCYSAEESTDRLLTWLSNHHVLDSTLIIFTSDNGFLFGEHHLHKKLVAYEESIRVPMFIRYPEWFPPGTMIENEITTNIDIAPTLLEAAGIADTFHMDGVSLHALATGIENRRYLFFEQIPLAGASWEAVRSFEYKYIHCYCTNQTEEFFDLVNDPAENTNLIFDPNYAGIIAQYRELRDSLRMATDDNVNPSLHNCSLNSFFYLDADEDGFGNDTVRLENKSKPSGYVADRNDCNDEDSLIHPGATDVCNSVDDDCDGVVDQNAITATVTPAGTISTCDGTAVILTANAGAGISYQWIRNSKNISAATNQTYSAKKAAGYKVKETGFDCDATSPATILVVNPSPAASITYGSLNLCGQASILLTANAGGGYTYQWKKGNTLLSGQTNQTYSATVKGTYKVIVTNSYGCSKTSEEAKVIKACKDSSLDAVKNAEMILNSNPASDQTTIQFTLPYSSHICIKVFDVNGKEIETLLDDNIEQGDHSLLLNTAHFAKGFYIVKMISDFGMENQKLIVQ